ncbi:MAG: hypothetical protein AB1765_07975 [Candidatus Hydrogenedentota bacterium]
MGNAIYYACGADITHMPVRPEDVWRAIHKVAQPKTRFIRGERY